MCGGALVNKVSLPQRLERRGVSLKSPPIPFSLLLQNNQGGARTEREPETGMARTFVFSPRNRKQNRNRNCFSGSKTGTGTVPLC